MGNNTTPSIYTVFKHKNISVPHLSLKTSHHPTKAMKQKARLFQKCFESKAVIMRTNENWLNWILYQGHTERDKEDSLIH